jgi:ABC-type transport system involved in multi-copper enzyme maturation permease subunit
MVYVWCTGALLLAAFVIQAYLEAIRALGIGVYTDPLKYPFAVAALACALYFSLWASTTISRERENGTLEALFWAPVDDLGLILGKILGVVVASVVFIAVLLGFLVVAARLTGLALPENAFACLPPAILLVGCLAAAGTLVSALASRVRTAVITLVAVVGLFFGLQIATGFLGNLPPDQLSRPLLLMRDSLILLTQITDILSPVQHFSWSLEALQLGNWREYAQSMASGLAHLAAFIAMSVLALKVKGVRR